MSTIATTARRLGKVSAYERGGLRSAWRKGSNTLMLGLTAISFLVAVTPLLWILWDIVRQGAAALTPSFFINLPTPVGVPGGGVLNS